METAMIGKAILILMTIFFTLSCGQIDDAGGRALRPGIVFPGQNNTSKDYVEFKYFMKGEYDNSKNSQYVEKGIVRLREMVPEVMKGRKYLALVIRDLAERTDYEQSNKFGVVLHVSDVLDQSVDPEQLAGKISKYYPNPVRRQEREEIWPFIYLHQAEVAKE
jgi:hypothetical protein